MLHSGYKAMGLLLLTATANAQVSGNATLFGKYFFRETVLQTGSGSSVTQTLSAEGNLNFDGNGNLTVTGQQLTGNTASAVLNVANGTYSVSPGGFVTMSNPLLPGVTINARLGAEGLLGSSTEAGSNVFDLLIAIRGSTNPVTSRALLGPYWVSSLEFPDGGLADVRETNFLLTSSGSGAFAENSVTGQANNLGNTPLTQTVGPITYQLNADGSGTMNFPPASGLDLTTQLMEGVKDIYVSADGSFFIGGSSAAGGHGIIVGVKAFAANPANNASWTGFYFAAGLRYDPASAKLTTVVGSVNPTAQGAVWQQHVHTSSGLTDATSLLPYSLAVDGSGSYPGTSEHINLGSNALVFSTTGAEGQGSPSYELFAGTSVLAQSGTGLGPFLHPLAVFNAASYVPPGYPVSPGGFVALFGNNLATDNEQAGIPFPSIVGHTALMVNGLPAPVYAISPTQINAVVPYGVTGSTATFIAMVNGSPSNSVTVPLAPTAPGVFSQTANGIGDGAITDTNSVVISQSNPAKPGQLVEVYLTGLGALDQQVADGAAAPFKPLANAKAALTVAVGGLPVTNIQFQGLSPGLSSLYQLNIQIPANTPVGPQMLSIQTANASTDLVDIWIAH